MNDFSIIITSWNAGQALRNCLQSLDKVAFAGEIVVVDSSSTDGSQEFLEKWKNGPNRKLVRVQNRGWSYAVDVGAEAARGNWLILSNPDIIFNDGLTYLLRFANAHPQYPILSVCLSWPDGRIQPCGRMHRLIDVFCQSTELGKYIDAALGKPIYRSNVIIPEKPSLVELPVGSFFMVARAILPTTKGLLRDKLFPIYCAEYDFFRRAKQARVPILYLPQVKFTHNLGHAAKLRTAQENTVLMFGGLVRYSEEWDIHPKLFKILYTMSALVSPPFWLVSRALRNKDSFRLRVSLSAIALAVLWR